MCVHIKFQHLEPQLQGEFSLFEDFGLHNVAGGSEKLEVLEIVKSQGSFQGNICASDPNFLCANSSSNGALQNGLFEGFEVSNLTDLHRNSFYHYLLWLLIFVTR